MCVCVCWILALITCTYAFSRKQHATPQARGEKKNKQQHTTQQHEMSTQHVVLSNIWRLFYAYILRCKAVQSVYIIVKKQFCNDYRSHDTATHCMHFAHESAECLDFVSLLHRSSSCLSFRHDFVRINIE